MSWQVRRRCDDDLAGIRAVLDDVYAADGYPVEGPAATMARVAVEVPAGAWVAELAGQVVGHVVLLAPKDKPAAGQHAAGLGHDLPATAPPATLARLAVHTQARGRGIASALVDAVVAEAQSCGWSLVLDVLAKDAAAISLYERRGWVRFAEFVHEAPAPVASSGAGTTEEAQSSVAQTSVTQASGDVEPVRYPGYAYRYDPSGP